MNLKRLNDVILAAIFAVDVTITLLVTFVLQPLSWLAGHTCFNGHISCSSQFPQVLQSLTSGQLWSSFLALSIWTKWIATNPVFMPACFMYPEYGYSDDPLT